MQRIDTYAFYNLGTQIHALERVKKGDTFRSVLWTLWLARAALDSVIDNQLVSLDICKPACYKLRSHINQMLPEDVTSLPPEKFDEAVDDSAVWNMQAALKEFETVFAAELRAADVYSVSQKEAYNTSDLIGNAEKIFPEAIRAKFSAQTLDDVRHAGRCLAFNLATAAGFHITRALENVVLELSKIFPGTPPIRDDLYSYIRVLEQNGVDKDVITELDKLRENYRNQLMHPEKFLSDTEISVLLSDVKNVMVKLHHEMEKKKALLAQSQDEKDAPVVTLVKLPESA